MNNRRTHVILLNGDLMILDLSTPCDFPALCTSLRTDPCVYFRFYPCRAPSVPRRVRERQKYPQTTYSALLTNTQISDA